MIVSTFNSIIVQLKSFDEIVVVDSSRSENIKDYIIGNAAKVLASPIIILHQMAFMMRKTTASRSQKTIGFVL